MKDLLAYLQLIDNSNYDPAAIRIINTPKRNIGNKVNPSTLGGCSTHILA